jgi:hypothetical protein
VILRNDLVVVLQELRAGLIQTVNATIRHVKPLPFDQPRLLFQGEHFFVPKTGVNDFEVFQIRAAETDIKIVLHEAHSIDVRQNIDEELPINEQGDPYEHSDPFFKQSLAIQLTQEQVNEKPLETGIFDIVLVPST